MAVSRTSADHAAHDELMLAVFASGDDLPAEDLARVEAQVRECAACALVVADLRAIQAATVDLPAPPRRRDFRLTEADAARLHQGRWRRLLAGFGSPRDRVSGPAAAGLATLGIAGILLVGVSGMSGTTEQSTVSSPIQATGAGEAYGAGGATAPEVATVPSAAADQMTTMAEPVESSGLKMAPALPESPLPAGTEAPVAVGGPPDTLPAATATPAAVGVPSATPVPAATATPIPVGAPSATPMPLTTATPAAEGAPSATPAPAATAGVAAPLTIDEPGASGGSAAPSLPAPSATPMPSATATPAADGGPSATPLPAATAGPVAGGGSAAPSHPASSAAPPTTAVPVAGGGATGTPLPAESAGPMAVTVPESAGPVESGVTAPDVAQVAPVASEEPTPVATRASAVPEGGVSPQALAGVLSLVALLAGLVLLGLRLAGRRIASRDQVDQ